VNLTFWESARSYNTYTGRTHFFSCGDFISSGWSLRDALPWGMLVHSIWGFTLLEGDCRACTISASTLHVTCCNVQRSSLYDPMWLVLRSDGLWFQEIRIWSVLINLIFCRPRSEVNWKLMYWKTTPSLKSWLDLNIIFELTDKSFGKFNLVVSNFVSNIGCKELGCNISHSEYWWRGRGTEKIIPDGCCLYLAVTHDHRSMNIRFVEIGAN